MGSSHSSSSRDNVPARRNAKPEKRKGKKGRKTKAAAALLRPGIEISMSAASSHHHHAGASCSDGGGGGGGGGGC
ncbi:hypothetical protein BOTBODRAFT_64184 [Botryobasidium botryosum FD-172 SS1]|uniref:Uncharacterized protein n=1 Tax=Botryobasidium botryosum (strain FD-172 SS1) TaxID=930990 RepID=A0A067MSV5_BOTB1|nr:hypothetical protein BOTBODRAFT_64184 [Botryobasidium botryosum FD-172 SS1]